MAKKKEFVPPKFKAKLKEEKAGKVTEVTKEFEIIWPAVIVPGLGKFTAAELVDDKNERGQQALAELVKRKSGILREVVVSKKGGK